MSKGSSDKTDAMREQREAQWAANQSRAKADAAMQRKKPPPEPPSGVGSLDNEASTPSLPDLHEKPASGVLESGATGRSAARARAAVASSSSVGADGRRAPKEGEGRCSSCGKLKTLARGRVPSHQKGMGKACPGSGKAPS